LRPRSHTKETLVMIRPVGFFSLLAFLLVAAPAVAQQPPRSGESLTVHPEARTAIDGLKSPYCPGSMLEVCSSSGGAMLRDTIQAMAELGLAGDSIIEIILAEYGEQWRAEPKVSGTGMWAWLLPPFGIVGGLTAVGVILARRKREEEIGVHLADPTPEDKARIRDALKVLDEEEEPAF
jgi:cytochrome c-type biogenesis protein CcmH/NrfF